MKYEKLGSYISEIKAKNSDLSVSTLKGINMRKEFIPSVANTIGTDMSKYRIVKRGQFAYNPMHVGRDHLVPISLLLLDEAVIVSPAYAVFEIVDTTKLLPQYLMTWFKESDFDRQAWFSTDNSIRGSISWDAFCELQLPVPSPSIQAAICVNRIIENQKGILEEKELLLGYIGVS